MTASDPLELLDFTPRPLTCDTPARECEAVATTRLALSCGCVHLMCAPHAMQFAAITSAPHLVAVCHIHHVYPVRTTDMEEIAS